MVLVPDQGGGLGVPPKFPSSPDGGGWWGTVVE